jgi:hypothetical protein
MPHSAPTATTHPASRSQRRQKEADVTNLHFADNEARSRKYCGRILLELIPLIDGFDPAEKAVRDEAGETSIVKINEPYEDAKRKKTVHHELDKGTYQPGVRTGPTYSSQREQENERVGEVIKAAPDLMYVLGDKFFETSDGPGSKQMAERMKRFIQMKSPGLIEDDQHDPRQQMQQVAAKAQQLEQQNQQLNAQLQDLSQQIATNQAEQAAKIRIVEIQEASRQAIAAGADATKVAVAQITTKAQDAQRAASDAFTDFSERRAMAHEIGLTAMEHGHAADMQQQQQAAAVPPAEPTEEPQQPPAAAAPPNELAAAA